MEKLEQPLELRVDIVSDVVCPWCIVGYLQLRRALKRLDGEFLPRISWHPFELNPQMPDEGQDLREHIAQKYGSNDAESEAVRDRLTALGADLGFTFNYFEGMRMVNTFRAHQLLHWAGVLGRQTELQLALFEAFFSRAQDVNDADVLAAVAATVGLPADEARDVIGSARYASAVREEQRYWLDRDVHAVPTFFFQGQYMVPGAQAEETFVRVLQKVRARSSSGTVTADRQDNARFD
ncbi:MAG: DsbA family oxidoreductase [Halioglobus sp.]|nr:DsbA family oxidoreductase [Halioglobus sp.]